MVMRQNEWERTTWRVTPRLEVPELAPCAVQYAILDGDPLPRFQENLGRIGAIPLSDVPGDQASIARSVQREAAWDLLFRDVTGDRLFLLTDFGPPPHRGESSGDGMVSTTRPFVSVSSNDAEGRRWLVTKILHANGKRLCWSIPFEARRGHLTDIALRSRNMIDLESEPLGPATVGTGGTL